ncbi:MAG TPA: 8-amino-7-oxononanoate synthase [Polyangiales bacterium]|nr:8-amino-7-oxononanoate synthase [Polyangiales bacterium]
MKLRIDDFAEHALDAIRAGGTHRHMRVFSGPQRANVQLEGRTVAHFAGSNYLDLAHHPEVVEAAAGAARDYGCAVGGSRLICGNLDLHEALEAELAAFLGVQAALVFSSGYMANLGVLPSLLGPGDVVLSDALNHASIVDACRLSRAEVRVFAHGDVAACRSILRQVRAEGPSTRRMLLVADGVYSMDGDLAPLRELGEAAREHDAWLMLDDAHGFGCLGEHGRGSAELLAAEGCIDVYVGTLGKALGSFGAFVAGSARLRELLVNTARSFIFTCALSAPQVAAARAALRILGREPARRQQLQANAELLRRELAARGVDTRPSCTQIVPVVLGGNARTMAVCERLLERGYYAQGIRHPSVPDGSARLRVTLMSSHDAGQIRGLAAAIADTSSEELPL